MDASARRAIAAVRDRSAPGRIAAVGIDVHFHPDARAAGGAGVLEALARDLRWRTQFETGTSNGGLTARPGGDRWRWESRLFDGAYDRVPAEHRPVYGGLAVRDDPYGATPRFGSAHLRLAPRVFERTTLCFPDSAYEPEAVGTVDAAGAVLEAVERVRMDDPLDRYVEAHVHGGLHLGDVDAVVLDPSFRGGPVEAAAVASGLVVQWHPGWALSVDRMPALDGYRGAEVVAAAVAIAGAGPLSPAVLGAARSTGALGPQLRKRVWHLLAAFGRTAPPAPSAR